ncbi:unnamed protein product [Staurois parvus]|uniref:Uncharacterized protein n=1 Tax=Staurois parvus TaxID=386267 RepID=A0ABN9D7Y2_9NEOB|nr:unnamed protein product [Staurois parvus]
MTGNVPGCDRNAMMGFPCSGTTRVCEDIGGQVLACGRRVSPEEWTANIKAICAETLRNIC